MKNKWSNIMVPLAVLSAGLSSAAFAGESSSFENSSSSAVYIRNVCDTLKQNGVVADRVMRLVLDSVIVTEWTGDPAAPAGATVVRSVYGENFFDKGFENPYWDSYYPIPKSLGAQCVDASDSIVRATFTKTNLNSMIGSWIMDSVAVSSRLIDANEAALSGYGGVYNWVAYTEGAWPSSLSFDAEHLFLSWTFDVHAASYHAYAVYFDTTKTTSGTTTTTRIDYHTAMTVGLDSAAAFDSVVSTLKVPSGKSATVKLLKIVLSDEKTIPSGGVSSSSAAVVSSSSSAGPEAVVARAVSRSSRYTVLADPAGFIVRGPNGEVPELRSLKGTAVNAESPVRAGVYFAKVPGEPYRKIVAK